MEKFFKLLYYYCLVFFVAFITYMTIVMYISPRQDAEKRGFIPCTEELVQNLTGCETGKLGCAFGFLWNDMKCNVSVVLNGLGAWTKGQQPTPWANYLFKPVTEAEQEGIYFGSADGNALTEDFLELKKQELEEAKQRNVELDETVLRDYPEIKDRQAPENIDLPDDVEVTGYSADIGDEVLIDSLSASAAMTDTVSEQSQMANDTLENIKNDTDEKIKEEKDENEK